MPSRYLRNYNYSTGFNQTTINSILDKTRGLDEDSVMMDNKVHCCLDFTAEQHKAWFPDAYKPPVIEEYLKFKTRERGFARKERIDAIKDVPVSLWRGLVWLSCWAGFAGLLLFGLWCVISFWSVPVTFGALIVFAILFKR